MAVFDLVYKWKRSTFTTLSSQHWSNFRIAHFLHSSPVTCIDLLLICLINKGWFIASKLHRIVVSMGRGVRECEQLHSFGVIAHPPWITHPPHHRIKKNIFNSRWHCLFIKVFVWSCGNICDSVLVRGGFILIDQPIRLFALIRSGGWNLMNHAHTMEWEVNTMYEYCT